MYAVWVCDSYIYYIYTIYASTRLFVYMWMSQHRLSKYTILYRWLTDPGPHLRQRWKVSRTCDEHHCQHKGLQAGRSVFVWTESPLEAENKNNSASSRFLKETYTYIYIYTQQHHTYFVWTFFCTKLDRLGGTEMKQPLDHVIQVDRHRSIGFPLVYPRRNGIPFEPET